MNDKIITLLSEISQISFLLERTNEEINHSEQRLSDLKDNLAKHMRIRESTEEKLEGLLNILFELRAQEDQYEKRSEV